MQYSEILFSAVKILVFFLFFFFFFFFFFFAQNIDCGYTLEPSRRGDSNEYPQSLLWSKIREIDIPLHTPVLLYKMGFKGV